MNREICPKVKVIMNHSLEEAKTFDDIKVRPEHIILSILIDNDNECTKVLKSMNINVSDLYDILSDYVRKTDLTPRIATTVRTKLPLSDESKLMIKSLDTECEKLNDNMIDTIHIMLAVLLTKSKLTEFLNSLGLNYIEFKKEINNMRDEQSSGFESDEENEPYKRKPTKTDSKTKTPVLDNFCRDVSKAVEKGELDPVVGRATEIKRVSQILSRRKKNNPVLIGEPGVGKCFCSDTEVVMRNDLTGEVFKITINEFLKTFSKP